MFNQMKQITKATSNQKTDNVITNILIRVQEEATCKSSDAFKTQESEVEKLAKVLDKRVNSIIPFSWIDKTPTHHQAHLERISDFLLLGKGVWWTQTSDGIEFFDGATTPTIHEMDHIYTTLGQQTLVMWTLTYKSAGNCVYKEEYHYQLPLSVSTLLQTVIQFHF
jgi:hypothetical protein